MFKTPKGTGNRKLKINDGDRNKPSAANSSSDSNLSDDNEINIVDHFGEIIKFVTQKRSDEVENLLMEYVVFTQNNLELLNRSQTECCRLQTELDARVLECSDLESKLREARKIVDNEKKKTKRAIYETKILKDHIKKVKEVVLVPNKNLLPEDARQKLSFLNKYEYDFRNSPGPKRQLDLSDITEGNSTGSLLSDFSHSKSRDVSGWDFDVSSNEGQSTAKRRKSTNDVVAINPMDQVKATTIVTVQKDGPIIATSTIEAVPQEARDETEFSTPRNRIIQRGDNKRPESSDRNSNSKKLKTFTSKQHCLMTKVIVLPENCSVCNKKVCFASKALRCKQCRTTCHLDCKKGLPLSCNSLSGTPRDEEPMGIISDYTPNSSPMIPALIVLCVNEIEARGLNEIGLYRISGYERNVKQLKQKLLTDRDSQELSKADVHDICGTIKSFLKSLKESLVTRDMWDKFVLLAESGNRSEIQEELKKYINSLPQPNKDTLAFLLLHLKKIAKSPECKMPESNLVLIFAPTIVGYSTAVDKSRQTLIEETRSITKVMDEIFKIPEDYWKDILSVSTPRRPNMFPLPGTCSTDSLLRLRGDFTPKSEKKRQRFFPTPK